MEPLCDDGGLFYMGAQTEWLPADQFTNIDNWEDSLKPFASHYIKQVEEWISAKKESAKGKKLVKDQDALSTVAVEQSVTTTTSVTVTKVWPVVHIHSIDLTLYKLTVDGEKHFACSVCGKTYARKDSLNQHLRVHSGEKPFACNVCGKTFAWRHCLNQHLRIHSGEKPFSCSQCGKAFTHKVSLTRHACPL